MNTPIRNLPLEEFVYLTKLTEKQKKFVACIALGKNLIEAYKEAYDTKSSNKVIGISANSLLKNPKIIRALEIKNFELNKANSNLTEKNKLQQYLTDELMDLSKKVIDKKTRLKILEMLFDISKK